MKKFKNILLISVVIIGVIIIYIVYDGHFSPSARIGKENMKKSEKLKIGMTENDLINIMGKTDATNQEGTTNDKIYKYHSDNVDYLEIEVHVDSTGKIDKVFIPKEE